MATSQKSRSLRVEIGAVDPEQYMLLSFKGREAVSELFRFELEIAAEIDHPFDFADVLGKRVIVDIGIPTAFARSFIGIISTFRQVRKSERHVFYTAEMVPPLWLLKLKQTSFIFQQQTTKEILEQRLGQVAGLQNNTIQPTKTYFPRNFCAQYRETDFDFVSRLMEDEGIFYYFDHTGGGKPELVVSDSLSKFRDLPREKKITFRDDTSVSQPFNLVSKWTKSQVIQNAMVMLQDTNFQKPNERFNSSEQGVDSITAGTVTHNLRLGNDAIFPIVDAPGGYSQWRDDIDQLGGERGDVANAFDDGHRIAKVRMQAIQALAVTIEAHSTNWLITPGYFVTLEEHFDANGDYLITSVEHDATCTINANSTTLSFEYKNRFTCQPAKMEFRPQVTTYKPYIAGTQTALVVGSDGAEIDPDKFGRVKVFFHWDIDKPKNLNTSCWVRVAQFWAGRQWGAQFIPRIGDEVVVAFEEGDPDKPIIIGSVYNLDNMPIYKLPENKTQSGIKTTSSPDGTTANFNELKFEDKKGAEFISIHAEKDMMTTVENLHTISVGSTASSSGSDTKKTGTMSTTVYGDTSLTVTKGDYTETIKAGTSTTEVQGKVTETYHNVQETNVDGKVWEKYHNELETAVDSNVFLRSGATIREEANGGDFFMFASGKVEVKANGSNVDIIAPTEINLTVGGSSIKITTDTITISATNIKLNGKKTILQGSSEATLEGKTVTVSGSTTTVTATGVTEVKGSTIKLNS